jgi:hypothetical protein
MTKKPFGEPADANAPDPHSAQAPEQSVEWIDDAADILRTIEGEAAYREVLEAARSPSPRAGVGRWPVGAEGPAEHYGAKGRDQENQQRPWKHPGA